MRLITKLVPIIFMGFLLLGISSPVSAEFNPWSDFKLPQVKPPQIQVGQSASYKINLVGVPDAEGPITGNFRIAVVGMETIEGQPFYWFEYDIGNLVGLPADVSGFVSSLKLKVLAKNIPQDKYQDDPKALMQEFARGNIMRKLVFQLNNDVPQMIDFMTLNGLAQMMGGQDLESLIEEIPFDEVEDTSSAAEDVKIDCGNETANVAGKAYSNSSFCAFEGKDEDEGITYKGKFNMHESVPIGAFLKLAFDVHNTAENETVTVKVDLTGYKTSGAISQITQEPVPFDFGAMMGGMMGGMPPMGGME